MMSYLIPIFMNIYSNLVMETIDSIELLVSASIAIFSVLLLVLSISGYQKTRIRLTIYAVIIFGLFAIQQFLDSLDDLFPILDNTTTDFVGHCITLVILIIFFLAIVKAPTKS